MSSEQERPVLPNSTPTGCQITSVIAWAVTPICTTPSHYLAILEMAVFCSSPFLGDLFLSEVACGKPPACRSPASWSHMSLVCCSCRIMLRWDEGCCKTAAELHPCQQLSAAMSPPRGWVIHQSMRGGGFWGVWSVPARNKVLRDYCN